MNKSRGSVLQKLYKEFKKLEKGRTIQLELKPDIPSLKLPFRVYWESDVTASYDNPDEENILRHFTKVAENITWEFDDYIQPEIKRFNEEIKTFVEKCDKFALEFGEDKNQFFESMMCNGMDKENEKIRKNHIKHQIKETQAKLIALKRQL